jgi:hypothetical protein
MDVAAIVSEFGAYYINQGQNASRLVKLLYEKSETEKAFTTVITDETKWRGSEAVVSRLLQPFQKQWTPTGAASFKPIDIDAFKLKLDFEDYPDELEATWLGFLADANLDRKEWPFVRWLVETHILPRMNQDYELNEIFLGVYGAPTPGTPGAAGTAMNGIKHIRNSFIDAGRITPILTGPLETDPMDFVDQIEEFVDDINTRYWNQPMELNVSQQLERRYLRGYERKYGRNLDYKGMGTKVEGTNITLVGRPSHNGSDIIWATPAGNAVRLVKKSQNMNQVRIENVDRKVKLYTDFWTGIGFLIPEIVFTNDVEINGGGGGGE